jgi:hypothetical protein
MSAQSGDAILNQVFNGTALAVTSAGIIPAAPQAYGFDATGQDTYATIVTASANRAHLIIHNAGTNPAIISVDSGTTDHFYVPGGAVFVLDNLLIASGATVQAKNGSAGNNYANLFVMIW